MAEEVEPWPYYGKCRECGFEGRLCRHRVCRACECIWCEEGIPVIDNDILEYIEASENPKNPRYWRIKKRVIGL